MTSTRKAALAAFLMAGSIGVAGTVFAAPAETPVDKAELAQLSPKLRGEVETRMKDGQSVRGILETMLLNNVSSDFASGRVVATDFGRGEMVVENKAGQLKAFPFDVTTLVVRN